VLAQLMEVDVAAMCGPKGKHDASRAAVRHGQESDRGPQLAHPRND
jgi:putative transposase